MNDDRSGGKATMDLALSKSHDAFARAMQLMPGGVNSPARAFGAVGGEPLFVDRAEGAYLFDIDGNRFIDYIGSWGPMIVGHRHPQVEQAVLRAVQRGTSYGAPTLAESQLAELLIEMVPSIEMVRLVSSGTEATMSAIRLARGFTGRSMIVKFAGHYHGHVDSLLVAAGSAAATLSVPNSPGVTLGVASDTLVLPFNDIPALEEAFQKYHQQLAAVIVEPIVGNMGCVPPAPGYLERLRQLTSEAGTVLIFDEVITGFRVAPGGAQQLYGVTPDLTTLGKILGGGMPIGAYGGRTEIMQHILPAGKVFQAGTLSGNPVATAAGLTTLKLLRDHPPYEQLERSSHQLAAGLASAAQAAGLAHCVQRVGSMLTLFFQDGPVRDWNSASRSDTTRYARFFWGMIQRGVYLPCSQYEALFVSAAHSAEDIEQTIAAAHDVCAEMAAN